MINRGQGSKCAGHDSAAGSVHSALPVHGGDLSAAARRFGRGADEFLDLSTGINRAGYPLDGGRLAAVARRLPEPEELAGLHQAAAAYYGVRAPDAIIAGPGSQFLSSVLALLLYQQARQHGASGAPVIAIKMPGYVGHGDVWSAAGWRVVYCLQDDEFLAHPAPFKLCINPNNPDGRYYPPAVLHELAAGCYRRGGALIIDEAFADLDASSGRPVDGALMTVTDAAIGVASDDARSGRIVLKSFGKFFGLPGVRLGFMVASGELVDKMAALMGPWPLSGPALVSGRQALEDGDWQAQARADLLRRGTRLDRALDRAGLTIAGRTGLFRLIRHKDVRALYQALGYAGILTRIFDYPAEWATDHAPHQASDWLRLGLPGNDHEHQRFITALDRSLSGG